MSNRAMPHDEVLHPEVQKIHAELHGAGGGSGVLCGYGVPTRCPIYKALLKAYKHGADSMHDVMTGDDAP